jgi:hypothetical protein
MPKKLLRIDALAVERAIRKTMVGDTRSIVMAWPVPDTEKEANDMIEKIAAAAVEAVYANSEMN